jgi:hypothetical protein
MPLLGSALLHRSATAITYLLRDDFTTLDAAPLGATRTPEPGPGSWAVTEADGSFSVDGSTKLNWTDQTTPAFGDLGIVATPTAVSRVAGRALIMQVRWNSFGNFAGVISWNRTASIAIAQNDAGVYFQSSGNVAPFRGAAYASPVFVAAATTDYQVAIIQRSAGAFLLMKGGTLVDWSLLWVDELGNNATLYPAFAVYDIAGTSEFFSVRDLGGAFGTDNGVATLNQSSPTSNTDYAATADGIFDLTVTAPNPLGTSQADLIYRRQDANNYWTAYFNSAGDLRLDSIESGVASNRLSVTGVITAGQTQTIRVIAAGTKHNCYTLNGSTWTKRGAEVNVTTVMDVATITRPLFVNGYSSSLLRVFPRTAAAYTALG